MSGPSIKSGFTLGRLDAKFDKGFLDEVFLNSDSYKVVLDKDDFRCFLVGRTGSGKTALITKLEQDEEGRVVRINPDDLGLPYVSNIRNLLEQNPDRTKLRLAFVVLWRHVLLMEILRHRYKSDDQRRNFMDGLIEKVKRDPAKKRAAQYLENFGYDFWQPVDIQVETITEAQSQEASEGVTGGVKVPVASAEAKSSTSTAASTTREVELKHRYQYTINDNLLGQLNQIVNILDTEILGKYNFTYVVIDDLDQGWVEDEFYMDLVHALFKAVYDFQQKDNIKFAIALRTNIFEDAKFTTPLIQSEKLEQAILPIVWSPRDLEEMLNKRIRASARKAGLAYVSTYDLLPTEKFDEQNAVEYIFRRTLFRPRDVIDFLNRSLEEAVGEPKLAWKHLHAAETSYSMGRFKALIEEWEQNYPTLRQVLMCFRHASQTFSKDEMQLYLQEVFKLQEPSESYGAFDEKQWKWLNLLSRDYYRPSATWKDMYGPMIGLLYRIGFIGIQEHGRSQPSFYAEEEGLADSKAILDARFVVHPMFSKALEIGS